MLLIATDEAGYGPKLGPFVLCGTAWRLPEHACGPAGAEKNPASSASGVPATAVTAPFDHAFSRLRDSKLVDEFSVKIDDSKLVFQPGNPRSLQVLHAVFTASMRQIGIQRGQTLMQICQQICPADAKYIRATPWLKKASPPPTVSDEGIDGLIDHWSDADATLIGIRTRVLTAARFNDRCDPSTDVDGAGINKADLLAESTLGIVRQLIEADADSGEPVVVFCDRFGGRRYYAAAIGQCLDCDQIEVLTESKHHSSYFVRIGSRHLTIHFSVKGDRFTPVALSSLIAKYLRERFMGSLNRYFAALARRHRNHPEAVNVPSPLKPTAGYPVDADRYLSDIDALIRLDGIDRDKLVRKR